MTNNQQAIVDTLIAEFTKINEQASTGNVIDLCEFKARFAEDKRKADAETLRKANVLAVKTEMAKQDYEVLKNNFEGTGIIVNFCMTSNKSEAPYLTITDKCGGNLKHIYYMTGSGNGLHHRETYIRSGDAARSATLAEHMAHKDMRDGIYEMYTFNQRNPS